MVLRRLCQGGGRTGKGEKLPAPNASKTVQTEHEVAGMEKGWYYFFQWDRAADRNAPDSLDGPALAFVLQKTKTERYRCVHEVL